MRVLLFTDTLADVNGVSRFITNLSDHARATGRDLHVITSSRLDGPHGPSIHNPRPLAAVPMPGYPTLDLALPPWRRMLSLARTLRPDAVHVSTPGPVGVVGRLAARRLGVPLLGVYHTDFPAYIDRLFENDLFTALTRACMRGFYRPFTTIFTRSNGAAPALAALGIDAPRVLPLRPGIKTQDFHPRFRDASIWAGCGSRFGPADQPVRLLYAGRVSVEKNLGFLAGVWRRADRLLRSRAVNAELVIVGDGPYRAPMEGALAGTRSLFLGFRFADELARLYASSDLFVFPSVTDTLGQVVMESQASGLPVLVTDQGGPQEVVRHGRTGFVVPASDPEAWVGRIVALCTSAAQRRVMGAEAHEFMQPFSLAATFEQWWAAHDSPRHCFTGSVRASPEPARSSTTPASPVTTRAIRS